MQALPDPAARRSDQRHWERPAPAAPLGGWQHSHRGNGSPAISAVISAMVKTAGVPVASRRVPASEKHRDFWSEATSFFYSSKTSFLM